MSSDAPSTASLFRQPTRTQLPEGRNETGALITCIRSTLLGQSTQHRSLLPELYKSLYAAKAGHCGFRLLCKVVSCSTREACRADHSQITWQVRVKSVCCPTPSNAYMITSTHRIEERTPAPLDHHHSCQHQSLHYLGLSLASQM